MCIPFLICSAVSSIMYVILNKFVSGT
jgi:hypothetical protein